MKCSKRHVSASVIIHKPVKGFPHLLRSCFRKRNHKNIKRIDSLFNQALNPPCDYSSLA